MTFKFDDRKIPFTTRLPKELVKRRNQAADSLGLPRSEFDTRVFLKALEKHFEGLSPREKADLLRRDISRKERQIKNLRYIDHAGERARVALLREPGRPYQVVKVSESWFSPEVEQECRLIEEQIVEEVEEVRRILRADHVAMSKDSVGRGSER